MPMVSFAIIIFHVMMNIHFGEKLILNEDRSAKMEDDKR
jgi:hypothetical protein